MTLRIPRPTVSVVIGSLNRRWHLERTIESVRGELEPQDREIIVVDGGSEDGSLRWLIEQKDIITVTQHNRGGWEGRALPRRSWGYFMNLGFRLASAPFVCMLSDDCLVVPGALRRGLADFGGEDSNIGAVAFHWRDWPEQRRYKVGVTWGDRLFVNHGMYRRQALEEVGFADAENFAFYHGDGDLALRMDAAGWPCVAATNSYVEHFGHANVTQRAANLALERADWASYEQRWGHLGRAATDWLERDHRDPHKTALRRWGARGLTTALWHTRVVPGARSAWRRWQG